jgi:hypothetical protein
VNGTIVEQGSHDEQMARPTEYNRLYTLQLLEQEVAGRGKVLH